MRTALIAAIKRTNTGQPRAELMMAGRSVLAWQAGLARDLGCERIICICDTPTDLVLTLQKEIEQTGGEFHAIRSNLQLVSLIRSDDELVMMLDGLLPDRGAALDFAGGQIAVDGEKLQHGIATIAASHTLTDSHSEDFERIDGDRHWAGFGVMNAGQVHKLADLPPDGDVMSLLLRLGLQARTQCRELRSETLAGNAWALADNAANLEQRERALIEVSSAKPPWTGPGAMLAGALVKRAAPRWLYAGTEASAGIALLFMLAAIGLASFGYGAAGLGIAALAALVGAICAAWGGLRQRLWSDERGTRTRTAVMIGVDVAALITLILAYGWSANAASQIALPILAIGLARLASSDPASKAGAFWHDRALHLAGFAVAAAAGYLDEAISVFAIAALAQLIWRR